MASPTPTNWSSAHRTAAERKWNAKWCAFTQPANELMLRLLGSQRPAALLDVATGTGEPAVTFARHFGPATQITGVDLATEILEVAGEHARAAGVANVKFQTAFADALPFTAGTFDALTCRWGVMFFPDTAAALREFLRVLRPGGRAVIAAWGPIQEQPFFLHTVGVMRLHMGEPLTEPDDVPSPFRFSRPEKLHAALQAAGFAAVDSGIETLQFEWPGPARELWTFWTEITSNYRAPLDSLSAADREALGHRAEAHFREYFDGHSVRMPAKVVWATGVRP